MAAMTVSRVAIQTGASDFRIGCGAIAAERLSCRSSVLPWCGVPDDGVGDGEELPHAGHDGDLGRLAGLPEPFVGGLEGQLVADRHQDAHEQGGAGRFCARPRWCGAPAACPSRDSWGQGRRGLRSCAGRGSRVRASRRSGSWPWRARFRGRSSGGSPSPARRASGGWRRRHRSRSRRAGPAARRAPGRRP